MFEQGGCVYRVIMRERERESGGTDDSRVEKGFFLFFKTKGVVFFQGVETPG